jgi:hypothetical protein
VKVQPSVKKICDKCKVIRRHGRVTGAAGSARSGGCEHQPWRCLWRRFSQITITRPCRRITLHLSQMGLTLGLTFTVVALLRSRYL